MHRVILFSCICILGTLAACGTKQVEHKLQTENKAKASGSVIDLSQIPIATYLPAPVRSGDILYWNSGTGWTTIPGNNSGTVDAAPAWTVIPGSPDAGKVLIFVDPKEQYPIVAPHTVTKTYETFGCPDGYEGHYLSLSSGFSDTAISFRGYPDFDVRVCITKKLEEELADAENTAQKKGKQ